MTMKRMLALLFALVMLVSAVSCGGPSLSSTGTGENPATAAETKEDAPPEKKYPTISHPLTKAEIDALPIANSSMTNEELRDLCVQYTTLMTSVVWTPSQSFRYECSYAGDADAAGNISISDGVRYGGLPYTSAASDLTPFMDLYDEKTGVLDVSKLGSNVGNVIGNNCATCVFWGWSRVSGSINYYGTVTMTQANGCLKLGPYTYDLTQTDFRTVGTGKICEQNGEQTMYESYALLRKADGVVMYNGGTTGHTRMVRENAQVVRNADGTIDGDKSTVKFVEQYSTQTSVQTEDGNVQFIGGMEREYTFKKLFSNHYIPFEIAELADSSKIQKGAVSLGLDKDTVTVEEVSNAKVQANYAISKTTVRVFEENGELAYENSAYGSAKGIGMQRTMEMSRILSAVNVRRNLKAGTKYKIEVQVRLGNGETITAYSGSVQA